jgi:hypothetical protein
MARGRGGSATAEWREPASSGRLPTHRSESPTGYSSAGCSPAEPASASPVTDNISPIPIPASQSKFRCSTSLPGCTQTRAPRALANRVSSLLCTPGDISILRRHQHGKIARFYGKKRAPDGPFGPGISTRPFGAFMASENQRVTRKPLPLLSCGRQPAGTGCAGGSEGNELEFARPLRARRLG